MEKINTKPELLMTMGNKVRELLHLPMIEAFHVTPAEKHASIHQNIIGWKVFLHGYILTYWGRIQDSFNSESAKPSRASWRRHLIKAKYRASTADLGSTQSIRTWSHTAGATSKTSGQHLLTSTISL
jgi:hypothetical protein